MGVFKLYLNTNVQVTNIAVFLFYWGTTTSYKAWGI